MYKRVLLKLSGEALKQNDPSILDTKYLKDVCLMIKDLVNKGVQIGVVIGAGNIWRGKIAKDIGIDHAQADYMGMMGTVINATAVSAMLKEVGVDSVVFSAINAPKEIATPYSKEEAEAALKEKYGSAGVN